MAKMRISPELNGTDQYRATVNVGVLDVQGGSTDTAWPTERPE